MPVRESMTSNMKTTIVAGFFVVLAAGVTTYKWTAKPDLLITGIVVDRQSNRELPQALVTVVGRGKSTTTRDDGSFRISVPSDSPAVVLLRSTKPGYAPYELDVQVPSDGVKLQMLKQ
jgi:hypothetical protein